VWKGKIDIFVPNAPLILFRKGERLRKLLKRKFRRIIVKNCKIAIVSSV
jgi:hypothetical protein